MSWDKVHLNGEDSDACNFTVISGLHNYTSQETAMTEFCKLHLKGAAPGAFQQLYSHYVFGGPLKGGNDTTYPFTVKFAEFLKENKLGDVYISKPADNPRWHPGRHCIVVAWTPDVKAVREWWTKHGAKSR